MPNGNVGLALHALLAAAPVVNTILLAALHRRRRRAALVISPRDAMAPARLRRRLELDTIAQEIPRLGLTEAEELHGQLGAVYAQVQRRLDRLGTRRRLR